MTDNSSSDRDDFPDLTKLNIAGFLCPVCQETHSGNDRFTYVSSFGGSFYCCSYTCRDIAASDESILPRFELSSFKYENENENENETETDSDESS